MGKKRYDGEAEFEFLGALLGISGPSWVTLLIGLSAIFLGGAYLTVTHALGDVPGENSVSMRLFGPILLIGSLVPVWVFRDLLRKWIAKLRLMFHPPDGPGAAQLGDPVTPLDKSKSGD